MNCPKCNNVLPYDAVFCDECGAAVPKTTSVKPSEVTPANAVFCSSCGYKNEDESTFCENCGKPVVSQKAIYDPHVSASIREESFNEQGGLLNISQQQGVYAKPETMLSPDEESKNISEKDEEVPESIMSVGHDNLQQTEIVSTEQFAPPISAQHSIITDSAEVTYVFCSSCGTKLTADSMFCDNCGASLVSAPSANKPSVNVMSEAVSWMSQVKLKAKAATESAAEKAKAFADTTKLNSMISEEQRNIERLHYQLGRLCFQENCANPQKPYQETVVAILTSEQHIEEYQHQISQMKGTQVCFACGDEIPANSKFCNECGKSV